MIMELVHSVHLCSCIGSAGKHPASATAILVKEKHLRKGKSHNSAADLKRIHRLVPFRDVRPSTHWAAEILAVPNGENAILDILVFPLKLSDFLLSHGRCHSESVDPRHRNELPWIVVEAEASSLSAPPQVSSFPSSLSFPIQYSHI
jgi:hypothetical protein